MKIFYDCEFLEDGKTIELISIGIVTETGHEYYAVNSDAPWQKIKQHEWLVRNVVPSLPLTSRTSLDTYLAHPSNSYPKPLFDINIDMRDTQVKPHWVIANEVRDFILGVPDPELWAWYGAYDHVVLCQLWGRMIDLPKGVPMWTADLKQEAMRLGNPEMPKQAKGEHHALADARHNKVMAERLDQLAKPRMSIENHPGWGGTP
ncbi:3'-5' exoribonuclease domain-containing protein [Nonomuraea sp. MTCD27]|uniref:3'-5' exoribonuclease domain-containing protein n=1 Tax=Nonomuraea sp. MTCD27 TaxID=1676747 RepID=UPI0035BEF593